MTMNSEKNHNNIFSQIKVFIEKYGTQILENAFSYIVVFAMCAYGVGKIIQFDGAIEANTTVSEMTGMQLMWAFYGYSKPFVITLGVLEITDGILMLLQRTRILVLCQDNKLNYNGSYFFKD